MRIKARKFTALLCAVVMTACTGCAKLGIKDTDGLDNGKEPRLTAKTAKSADSDKAVTPDEDRAEILPIPEDQPSYVVSLLCAGDNLVHDNIYNEAWHRGGDGVSSPDAGRHVQACRCADA